MREADMRTGFLFLAVAVSLPTAPVAAQAPTRGAAPGPSAVAISDASMLAGKWTYRSFHNNPAPVGDDPNKALNLIFAEAVFTFEIPSSTTLKGTIDWPGGGLDLQGTIRASSGATSPHSG